MTKIALLGDSTFATIYLRAAGNVELVQHWGKDANYDGRLHVLLHDALVALGKHCDIVNYAIPGWTINKCLNQVQSTYGNGTLTQWEACVAADPDVVLINFGCNDAGLGVTKAAFKAGIEQVVTEAIAAGIVPVLVTNMRYQWGATGGAQTTWINNALAPYIEAYRELATTYDLTVIDVYAAFLASITGGTWDLWAHNDEIYYSGAENGSEPPAEDFYANLHEWFDGADLIAETMASTLVAEEPYPLNQFDLDVVLLSAHDLDVLLGESSSITYTTIGSGVVNSRLIVRSMV